MTTQTIAEQQKTFVIKIDKNIERTIDSATRKKLVDAYMKLFSGFAWVNWTKKQSLGRAWQGALGQCESFLKTKNQGLFKKTLIFRVREECSLFFTYTFNGLPW